MREGGTKSWMFGSDAAGGDGDNDTHQLSEICLLKKLT